MKELKIINRTYRRKKQHRPVGRPQKPPLPYKTKLGLVVRQTEMYAFRMFLESVGLKQRCQIGGTVHEWKVFDYMFEYPERYELKGKEIVRTVSTFHYLTQHTAVNDKCIFFRKMHRRFEKKYPLDVPAEVEGVHNYFWDQFARRYHLGVIKTGNSEGTDLDKKYRWVSFRLGREKYFLLSLKSEIQEGYTEWRMFRSKQATMTINPKIKPKMSQEEIIQELKNGKITTINKYGNHKKLYSPEQVLKIIEG